METYEQIKKAATALEEKEVEYGLKDLCRAASVTPQEAIAVLTVHWVKSDDLDITFLNLTKQEEVLVYGVDRLG